MSDMSDEVEAALKEARDFVAKHDATRKRLQERRERLDRHILTGHLVDVFENWDECVENGGIDDPSKIHGLAAKYLREYHESLGPITEYVEAEGAGVDE